MKPFYLLFCCLFGGLVVAQAQENGNQVAAIRPASFGFAITFNDFTTAQRIRRNSLSATLNNREVAKVSDMAPGISVLYTKGLRPQVDFSASFGFGSGRVYLLNKPDQARNVAFFVADAVVNVKLLPENFVVNPYVLAGVGATATDGFYGAILPLGAGFRFKLGDGTFIGLQSQYRIAVTETAGYHFVHGLSIMGRL